MMPIEFTRAQIEGLPLLFNNEDLIKALPDSVCIIVLPSVNEVINFEKSIRIIRPDYLTSNLRYTYSSDGKKLFPSIERPGEYPVYFDYRVLQMALLNITTNHSMSHIKISATYRFDKNRIVLIGSNIIAHDLKKRLFDNLTVPCEFTYESTNSRGLPILNVVYADFESKEDLQYYFMLNSELYKELTNVR